MQCPSNNSKIISDAPAFKPAEFLMKYIKIKTRLKDFFSDFVHEEDRDKFLFGLMKQNYFYSNPHDRDDQNIRIRLFKKYDIETPEQIHSQKSPSYPYKN